MNVYLCVCVCVCVSADTHTHTWHSQAHFYAKNILLLRNYEVQETFFCFVLFSWWQKNLKMENIDKHFMLPFVLNKKIFLSWHTFFFHVTFPKISLPHIGGTVMWLAQITINHRIVYSHAITGHLLPAFSTFGWDMHAKHLKTSALKSQIPQLIPSLPKVSIYI